jgi:hypothetical protein
MVALVLAFVGINTAAEAAVTKKVRGVQHFSDSVWTNELNGAPVAAFPLGCVENFNCQFTVYLAFSPPAQVNHTCVNDNPVTPWVECEAYPQCALWVEFAPELLPMRSRQGDHSWITAPIDFHLDGLPVLQTSDVQPSFVGVGYQVLTILGFEVEIFADSGLCRAGLAARYYQNSKTLFDQGHVLSR